MRRLLIGAGLAFCLSSSCKAATSGEWPCVQRKVPTVTLAAVWTAEPPGAEAEAQRSSKEIDELASHLAARRLPIEDARREITSLRERLGAARRTKLEALFLNLFSRLNSERGDVIAGIERYGRKQLEFAEKLRKQQELVAAKRAEAGPDSPELQELIEQFNWDARIFEERRKSLTFVCEVPLVIEKRLYDLARAIQDAIR